MANVTIKRFEMLIYNKRILKDALHNQTLILFSVYNHRRLNPNSIKYNNFLIKSH